jgi:ABC-type uncharacterized transport system substrate-binding protein
LVGQKPEIILARSTPAIVALQRETRTIPIVLDGVPDPVARGIVPRLDRMPAFVCSRDRRAWKRQQRNRTWQR